MTRFMELFQYRELVWNFVVRDLKIRYKHSILGFAWSLLNPLGMMAIFTVVFTIMLPYASVEKYPFFVLCALLPWNFFSNSVLSSMYSVVGNAFLIKKVYFPREVLPLSSVFSNLIHFLLALPLLFLLMMVMKVAITPWALLLPVMILVQLIFTIGLAMVLSTLNVLYRDTPMIMEVVLLAWFFLTPVFYPIEVLPQSRLLWGMVLDVRRLVYISNPMASIIASYRVILYHGAPPAFDFLSRTAVTALAMLVVGYLFFSRYSRTFAEEM